MLIPVSDQPTLDIDNNIDLTVASRLNKYQIVLGDYPSLLYYVEEQSFTIDVFSTLCCSGTTSLRHRINPTL